MKFCLSLALALSAVVSSEKVSYLGDKAYRISVGDASAKLSKIISDLELETWKGVNDGIAVANGFVDLVVSADKVAKFAELSGDFEVEVMHEDLGFSIQEEEGKNVVPYIAGRSIDKRDLSWWESYHPYAEHIAFMEDLVATYPKNSKIVYSGESVDGRPITGVHIWGRSGPGKQKAVILHGNVHPRELISSKTVEYLLYFILTNLDSSNEVRKFVIRYDFTSSPSLWRKNRQVLNSTTDCGARDINRNWPFHGTLGASTNPCNTHNKGLAPADTPEMKGLTAYNYKLAGTTGVQLYIDFHSYGQLFLSRTYSSPSPQIQHITDIPKPYGYQCDAYADNHEAHLKISRHAADAVREVYGTNYTYGQSCQYLYQTTGYPVDYKYAVTKARYSYLIELRDRGMFGFVLPPVQIKPVALETWQGFKEILKRI